MSEIKNNPEKCFFILSPRFHGTTIIGRLSTADDFCSYYGDSEPNEKIEKQICGCGRCIEDCEIWSSYLKLFSTKKKNYTSKYLILEFACHFKAKFSKNKKEYAQINLEKLSFLSNYEKRPIYVDGSKSISKLIALSKIGFQIDGIIHIRRRLLDYLISCALSGDTVTQMVKNLFEYYSYHFIAKKTQSIANRLSISYEDFILNPDYEINKIRQFIGVPQKSVAECARHLSTHQKHFLGNKKAYNFRTVIKKKRGTILDLLQSMK